MRPDYTIEIDGVLYLVEPGTMREGSVRRQVEVNSLQETDFKSRPETREFLQNTWTGGSRWEKPVYSLQNLDSYYTANDISATDTPGSVMAGRNTTEADTPFSEDSFLVQSYSLNSSRGAVKAYQNGSTTHRIAKWSSSSNNWTTTGQSNNASWGTAQRPMATTAYGDLVWVLWENGYLTEWDTTGTSVVETNLSLTPKPGSSLWADETYVYVYDGDKHSRYDHTSSYAQDTTVFPLNDGEGFNVFEPADGGGIVAGHAITNAINTAEGIFYLKNIYIGGVNVCKVFRIDRDASGQYIISPYGTLPPGTVGIDMVYHLGSILISTVPNLAVANTNTSHQQVTFYHITGNSIGSIGTPVARNAPSETPYACLLSDGDLLWIGGQDAIWVYDARVGAIHPIHAITGVSAGAFVGAAKVETTNGPATVFTHEDSTDGEGRNALVLDTTHYVSSGMNAYLESNYFDFDLPMEQKTVTEVFVDLTDFDGTSDLTVQLSADDAAFATVATFTADEVGRTSITPVTGTKFQYRLELGTENSHSPATKVRAIGFSALGGETVRFMQFTINGEESVNIENNVQDPYTVYTNMAALRDNANTVAVKHYLADRDGTEIDLGNFRVANVTASLDGKEGMYDVSLLEA